MRMKKKTDGDVSESLAFIIERMVTKDDIKDFATKDDVREIVQQELKPIQEGLTAVKSKIEGTNRRLDDEAMQRTDLKLPPRVHDLEEKVYGVGKSKHPKHVPL